MEPVDDMSIAGLSEPAHAAPEADGIEQAISHPFAITGEQRYREMKVVGAGGLGTVLLAHDERLAREVALKRMGPLLDSAQAAAQFAREARITARLDHPGIVPIHDAGVTADGRLFYTMRLIRGRSLAEILAAFTADAAAMPARIALTSALTAACHAVGYAHRQGIVHRDLKPANVMVGEFGECQVVDWGLADEVHELHKLGPFVGTAGYVSPEAVAGRGGTMATDVWALGVMLYEMIAGQPRFSGDRAAMIAALQCVPLPAVVWPEACPPELRAIGDKAMAPQPADRYRDGEAMALDLEAFRDGRRVAAHRYSAMELARRALWAWRWPLAVVGSLLVATMVVLALTAHRTEKQRVRAVAAESQTQVELQRSEASLAWALAASAVAAHAAGHEARAELLAAHALTHGESADARGVLAATMAGGHPRASAQLEIPGCRWVVPSSEGVALCVAPTYLELWQLAPVAKRWRVDRSFAGALDVAGAWVVAWTAAGVVQVLDASSAAVVATYQDLKTVRRVERNPAHTLAVVHDREIAIVLDPTTARRVVLGRICQRATIDAIAIGDQGSTYALCSDGMLRVVGAQGELLSEQLTAFGHDLRPATAMGLSEGDFDLAIGGAGGDVMLVNLRSCMSPSCAAEAKSELLRAVTTQGIQFVACLGREAIAIADGGEAVQVGWGLGAPLLRMPVTNGATATLAEGDVQTGGARWRSWRFGVSIAPRQWTMRPGVTTVALSPNGAMIAAASAKMLTIRDAQHGHLVAEFATQGNVVSVSFAADNTRVAIASTSGTGPGVQLFDVLQGAELPLRDAPASAEFVSFIDQHALRAVSGTRSLEWRGDAAPIVTPAPLIADGTVAADRSLQYFTDRTAMIWRWGSEFTQVGPAAGAVAIAVADGGQRIATAHGHRVTLVDAAGTLLLAAEFADTEILDLALSQDGRWLAVATSAGRIDVWSTQHAKLAARLHGHRQRVTWLQFRGDALWSASQDGDVLRWSVAGLDADAASTAGIVEQQWGLTLQDVVVAP